MIKLGSMFNKYPRHLEQSNSSLNSSGDNENTRIYGSIEFGDVDDQNVHARDTSPEDTETINQNWLVKTLIIISVLLFVIAFTTNKTSTGSGNPDVTSLVFWYGLDSAPTLQPTRFIDRIKAIHSLPVQQEQEEYSPSPTRRVERNHVSISAESTPEPTVASPSPQPSLAPSRHVERHFFTSPPTSASESDNTQAAYSTSTYLPTYSADVYYYYYQKYQDAQEKQRQQANEGGASEATTAELEEAVADESLVSQLEEAIESLQKPAAVVSEQLVQVNVNTDSIASSSLKPNIIFIVADDLGWNSIGENDQQTSFAYPFLSSLAQHGITMSNYYSQETCSPARAALLTGRYPISLGMQAGNIESSVAWGLAKDETLLSDVLQEQGYKTYALGKWHLGHHTPFFLPTARGFDSFLGFLSGDTYYWSKRNPDHPEFVDLLTSSPGCYSPYQELDRHNYSTYLYRDHAVELINDHDVASPMFMYLSFQGVRDPFSDLNGIHTEGIRDEYLPQDILNKIFSTVEGAKQQQYLISLALLDGAVNDIYKALKAKGMMDNSYMVFTSDNGACFGGGGANGALRGTSGSLFEGGVRVDAIMYGSSLPDTRKGVQYGNLMHVADWFPTLLDLAGVSFTPAADYELDGVSHYTALLDDSGQIPAPRTSLLINLYSNVATMNYDLWTNGSFAIRNQRFKLMHAYDSSLYGAWWGSDDELIGSLSDSDDDLSTISECSVQEAADGQFTYFLFDLVNDPYEQSNLYDATSQEVVRAKIELYNIISNYVGKAKEMTFYSFKASLQAFDEWRDHDNHIVPYTTSADMFFDSSRYPADCFDI